MTHTLAPGAEEEAVMPDGALSDPAALAAKREQRFQERKARIESDPTFTAAEKRWFLDRTLLGTTEQALMVGRGRGRITGMRRDKTGRRRGPHPMLLPDPDGYIGSIAGVPNPGIEAGRLRKHLVENGTHVLDEETGEMIRIADYRPGAPRRQRVTRTKPGRKGPSIPEQPTGD